MNLQNIAQREVLDFGQFLKKVHDNNYKPLAPSTQSEGGLERSGLSKIKREPAYDHVGYADSVFAGKSKIDVPGVRINAGSDGEMIDAAGYGTATLFSTSESLQFSIKRLSDF
jgi:hypothetical protein